MARNVPVHNAPCGGSSICRQMCLFELDLEGPMPAHRGALHTLRTFTASTTPIHLLRLHSHPPTADCSLPGESHGEPHHRTIPYCPIYSLTRPGATYFDTVVDAVVCMYVSLKARHRTDHTVVGLKCKVHHTGSFPPSYGPGTYVPNAKKKKRCPHWNAHLTANLPPTYGPESYVPILKC